MNNAEYEAIRDRYLLVPQPSTAFVRDLTIKMHDVQKFFRLRTNPLVEYVQAAEDELTEVLGIIGYGNELLHLHPKFSCLSIETWLVLVMAQCELLPRNCDTLLSRAMDAYLSGEVQYGQPS